MVAARKKQDLLLTSHVESSGSDVRKWCLLCEKTDELTDFLGKKLDNSMKNGSLAIISGTDK